MKELRNLRLWKRIWLAAILSVVAILPVIIFLFTTQLSAPSPVKLVPLTKIAGYIRDYIWINERTIIVLNSTYDQPVAVDIESGASVPLNLPQSQPGRQFSGDISTLATSPDRKRLLWRNQNRWIVSSLVDQSFQTSLRLGMQGMWMPDSQGWVECTDSTTETKLRLHYLNSNEKKEQTVLLPSHGEVLGFVRPNRILVLEPHAMSQVSISEYALDDGPKASTVYHYSFANNKFSSVLDVALSPDGTRLAWIESNPPAVHIPNHWDRILMKFLQKPRQENHNIEMNIWVSKIDGSDMHKVFCKYYAGMFIEEWSGILTLQWNPNGKSLSFVDQGELWGVPIR